jgi:hypothetical protein
MTIFTVIPSIEMLWLYILTAISCKPLYIDESTSQRVRNVIKYKVQEAIEAIFGQPCLPK